MVAEKYVWKRHQDHEIDIRETIEAWRTLSPTHEQIQCVIQKVGSAICDLAMVEFIRCARDFPPGQRQEFQNEVNHLAQDVFPQEAVKLFASVTEGLGLGGFWTESSFQKRAADVARQSVAPIARRVILLQLKGQISRVVSRETQQDAIEQLVGRSEKGLTLIELDKLSRADKLLEACQANITAALPGWAARFDARRLDLAPQQSLMVILLRAIEQACAFELRPWAEFAQSWSRDEFVSDIRRLVVPLVNAELTNVLLDLAQEREVHAILRPPLDESPIGRVLADITREAASLIENRAGAAFDTAIFRIANPVPECRFGRPADDYWASEEALEAEEFHETVAMEEAEVDPADEPERSDVLAEALNRPGETPEGPTAREPEGEQPQGIDEGLIECLQPRIRPDSTAANRREGRLQAFSSANSGTTLADIQHSAQVHKPDFYDWKSGKLPDTSVMSLRIDDVLAGRRRLQKKPRQRRPD